MQPPDLSLDSPIDRALFLRAQPAFARLDVTTISALAMLCRDRFARPGEWLHHEGTPMMRIAFLMDGEVRLMREGEPIRTVRAPATLGLSASLAGMAWTPGIIATESTLYLALDVSDLKRLLAERPPLVLEIARSLARERRPHVVRAEPPVVVDGDSGIVAALLALGQNPIFENVNLLGLIDLFEASWERRARAGDAYRPRDDALFVVLSGALEAPGPAEGRRIGPGDLGGLAELLADEPNDLARDVLGESHLLEIPRSAYQSLLEDHSDAADQLLRYLSADQTVRG